MAYATPTTWSVAEIVTAAQLNQEIRDNVGALHQAIAVTASTSAPVRVYNTAYQNTSSTYRMVNITLQCGATAGYGLLKMGTTATPSTTDANPVEFGWLSGGSTSGMTFYFAGSRIIPPAWYYMLEAGGATPTILQWTEFNFLGILS